MLVLYETPAGYALFQIKDDSKVQDVDDIEKCFADSDKANKLYVQTPVQMNQSVLLLPAGGGWVGVGGVGSI